MADQAPVKLVYIQGGDSTISDGPDGMMVITVKDIIPYFHMADDNTSSLIPVKRLSRFVYPLDAALVLSSDSNETISMVKISNLSFSDENTTLTLYANPVRYYEGSLLQSFIDKQTENAPTLTGDFKNTQIYAEAGLPLAVNDDNMGCQDYEEYCCTCGCAYLCGCYDPVTHLCFDW